LFISDARASWVWSPETGKWTNPKKQAKDTPEEQFEWAKSIYDDKDYKRALDEFKKLTNSFPNSPLAAEGEFYQGLTYETLGDLGRAAEAFRTLVDRYPYSNRVTDAIEHEYELAEAMLDGKRTKFLGMAIMPAQDTAVDLYKHIVKSAPYGPFGVKAQYRLGDAYIALGEFDLAQAAYQSVIDNYPNTEWAQKAGYQIARVSYKASKKESTNLKSTEEAIRKFEGFKQEYPQSQLELEANAAISELREKKARTLYDIGVFYQKQGKYAGSKGYFDDVVRQYPDTKVADQAKVRLGEIEAAEKNEKSKKAWWKVF
jgi:outer membrane assembly lipoprotein YfiO